MKRPNHIFLLIVNLFFIFLMSQVKCGSCGEISDKFSCVSASEMVDLPKSRGKAHLVQKVSSFLYMGSFSYHIISTRGNIRVSEISTHGNISIYQIIDFAYKCRVKPYLMWKWKLFLFFACEDFSFPPLYLQNLKSWLIWLRKPRNSSSKCMR